MKNSDTDWTKTEEIGKKVQKTLDVSDQKVLVEVEYVILKTKYLERYYYKISISLPFNCESNWGLTDYSKSSGWDERAVSIIKSTLKSRYKQIKLRNYKQFRFHSFLKENNIEIQELFHLPLHDKIKDVSIGDIFSEYEKLSTELKSLKIDDCKEMGDFLLEKIFNKLVLNGKCEYCGITMKEINQLSDNQELYTKRSRGYSMEIDQKDPNVLYTDDNCVASCYWCNNAKTDEFSVKEFKEIARGIHVAWKARLVSK